jgi:hypothetical protein
VSGSGSPRYALLRWRSPDDRRPDVAAQYPKKRAILHNRHLRDCTATALNQLLSAITLDGLMRSLIFAVLVLPAMCASALDFKGLEIGKPVTEAQVQQSLSSPGIDRVLCKVIVKNERVCDAKGNDCRSVDRPTAMKRCSGKTTIAGKSAKVVAVIDPAGNLSTLWLAFDNIYYVEVTEQLELKFPNPNLETLTSPNGSKVFFETWKDAAGNRLDCASRGLHNESGTPSAQIESACTFKSTYREDAPKRSSDL